MIFSRSDWENGIVSPEDAREAGRVSGYSGDPGDSSDVKCDRSGPPDMVSMCEGWYYSWLVMIIVVTILQF